MLIRLLDFIKGTRRVRVTKKDFIVLANTMMSLDIRYKNIKNDAENISFTISEGEYKKLVNYGCSDAFAEQVRFGLPYLLYRYRKRYGILAGAFIIMILTALSTCYVWDIRVEGNENISDAEIIENLSELGFGVGSNIRKTDFYGICHELLLINDNLSWVSVNMEGTGAVVKVIERDKKGENKDNDTPSNIVSLYDAEIIRTHTVSGQIEVRAGEFVKAGQLLINGIVGIGGAESGRFVLMRSRGSIYGKVNRVFEVEIPLNTTEKYVIKETESKKSIIFFSKTLKLKENSRISYDNCDIIVENKRVVLFEGMGEAFEIPLPIIMTTEVCRVYGQREVSYTEDEALLLAEKQMSETVSKELMDAELISKNDYYEVIDGVLKLTWEISCIQDIGTESPIGLI